MAEHLTDISGYEDLEPAWGERFRGWNRIQTFKNTLSISLGEDLTYRINVCDHSYRFIIPARIEFSRGFESKTDTITTEYGGVGKLRYGIIQYTDAERALGVFRYPLNEDGFFSAPVPTEKLNKEISGLTPDQIKKLVKKKKVLTFEAFRVPIFGFEYISMSKNDFKEIEILAGKTVSSSIQATYESGKNARIAEVKEKILLTPNNVLILQNILDQKYTNGKEISEMTNNIIHFGI